MRATSRCAARRTRCSTRSPKGIDPQALYRRIVRRYEGHDPAGPHTDVFFRLVPSTITGYDYRDDDVLTPSLAEVSSRRFIRPGASESFPVAGEPVPWTA